MSEAPFRYATTVQEMRSGRGEDCVTVVRLADRTIFGLADGAGGVAGGATAASAFCAAVDKCISKKPHDWTDWLQHLDREMSSSSGLSAAVVVEVVDNGDIFGASVGDCQAWVLGGVYIDHEMTGGQSRKPLLGSGEALPISFHWHMSGRLVIASDGLWKYATHKQIMETVSTGTMSDSVAGLVSGVRMRSGALQDDVAIIMCEAAK